MKRILLVSAAVMAAAFASPVSAQDSDSATADGSTTIIQPLTISKDADLGITITVPSSFDLENGTDTITVTLDPDRPASDTLDGTLGGDGTRALNVGGSFSLPDSVSTGEYTGDFTVTVAYN